jgi:hypothetical protein
MSDSPKALAYARARGMEYLYEIPRARPNDGRVLVHNLPRARRNQPLGRDGLRIFLAEPSERWERCACGWAAHLPEHYRTRREG